MRVKNPQAKELVAMTATDLTVCSECAAAIANNDYTGLDNNPASAEQRAAEIRAGLTAWNTDGFYLAVTGHAGYETGPCDCCNTHLAGDRHHAAALN